MGIETIILFVTLALWAAGFRLRRVRGHETVKGRILENFLLAGQFQATGIPVRSGPGRNGSWWSSTRTDNF
jgi:hypothetical protein